MNNETLILLDADVVIHFFHCNKVSIFNILFKGRIRILDVVLTELRANRSIRDVINNLIIYKQAVEIEFPNTSNEEMFREFVSLKSKIQGTGERACLVYCKYSQNIIASSNTKDIVPYCEANNVAYLTTLDFFCIAVERDILTEKEADADIATIFAKGSFLKCKSVAEYRKHHFDRLKLLY
jgi:hypothetical protein